MRGGKRTVLASLIGWCAAAALHAQQAPDVSVFDFEQGIGPFAALVFPPQGKGYAPPRVLRDDGPGSARTGSGALRFEYLRKPLVFPILHAPILLNDLQGIEFDVRSDEKALIALAVTDLDGAKFHYPLELAPKVWKRVQIRPQDFKLSDDSPVKKDALEPSRLSTGLNMLDALGLFGGKEVDNILLLDNLTVARGPLALRRGGFTVKQDTVWETPMALEGDLVVEANASLTIRSRRFRLTGKLKLMPGARVRIEDTLVEVPSAHPYQFGALVSDKARLEALRSSFTLARPWDLVVKPGGAWSAEKCAFPQGNVTVTAETGSDVRYEGVEQPGEMVISPGARVRLTDSKKVLLWFHLAAAARGALELPNGAYLLIWAAPKALGHDVEIKSSAEIQWGLVANEGCQVSVPKAELRTASFMAVGPGASLVEGLGNGNLYDAKPVQCGATRLDLNGTRVETWNLYAAGAAALHVKSSTFGEALAFGDAKIEVSGSTCDGTGGYLGARDRASLTVKQSTIKASVVAHNEAKIVLEDCTIEGDVTAADRSRVTLLRCKITGQVRRDSGAQLDRR